MNLIVEIETKKVIDIISQSPTQYLGIVNSRKSLVSKIENIPLKWAFVYNDNNTNLLVIDTNYLSRINSKSINDIIRKIILWKRKYLINKII